MITLTRNGAPKRSFSLAEQRAKEGVLEADVEACVPFMKVNTPTSSPLFPVRRAYSPVLVCFYFKFSVLVLCSFIVLLRFSSFVLLPLSPIHMF